CAPSLALFSLYNDAATTQIYTLSLHDALPISRLLRWRCQSPPAHQAPPPGRSRSQAACPTTAPSDGRSRPRADSGSRRSSETSRSEEHTSELQSPCNLVCRLLLEKKNRYVHRI